MQLTPKINERMSSGKKPKWEIGPAISAGNKALALCLVYSNMLEERFYPDEIAQLKANVTELEARRSGQTESLVEQKSKTIGQDEQAAKLRNAVVSIRNIVKSTGSVTPDIQKAYGVGERISSGVSSVIAAGNIVISAYNSHTAWSNSAGIIEIDIAYVTDLLLQLYEAEAMQNSAIFARKSRTMGKNLLQRAVEEEVSRISALGQHIFRSSDAAVAKLFEDLIPSTSKVKKGLPAVADAPSSSAITP